MHLWIYMNIFPRKNRVEHELEGLKPILKMLIFIKLYVNIVPCIHEFGMLYNVSNIQM